MKYFFSFFFFFVSIPSKSQSIQINKLPSISVNYIAFDFSTAALIKSTSLSKVIKDGSWTPLNKMEPGFGLSYMKGLSPKLDISIGLQGSFIEYKKANTSDSNRTLLAELEGLIRIKLLTDYYIIVPYVATGIGVSFISNSFGVVVPLGMGLQFKILPETFVFIDAQYRAVTLKNFNHFIYSVGIGSALTKRKKIRVKAQPVLPLLKTPFEQTNPEIEKDTDDDGIIDDQDRCPLVPGDKKYNGCPIPDSDKDGLNDEIDHCPNVPGLERYVGCPIPDIDNDGVNDEIDSCKLVPGSLANQGCPLPDTPKFVLKEVVKTEIDKAARQIFFETGKATLLKSSITALNNLVGILKAQPSVKLEIQGHTDSKGSKASNYLLSQSRANAVVSYLTKNGVEKTRLSAKGYGSDLPIETNNTEAGRSKNRRVKIIILD